MTIISKYWAPRVAQSIRTMKAIRDGSGVCFDLRTIDAEGFMENYEHMKARDSRRVDFECARIKTLPADLDVDTAGGSSGYHRGNHGGSGGYGGGGNGGNGYSGGQSNRGPRGGGGGSNYGNSKRRDEREPPSGGNDASGGWGGGASGWNLNPLYNQPDYGKPKSFNR